MALRDCTTTDLYARQKALRAELAAITTELTDRVLGESRKARESRNAALTDDAVVARLRQTIENTDDALPF